MTSLEDFFAENEKYQTMARDQNPVFQFDLYDLYRSDKDLSWSIIREPKKGFNELAGFLRPVIDKNGAGVEKKIRITNLIETTEMRAVDSEIMGELIQIEGMISSISVPYPEPTMAVFNCPRCGYPVEEVQEGIIMKLPKKCVGPDCKNTRFSADDLNLEETKYENIQRVEIQERPEELPPGEIPESFTVVLRDDLIRTVTPGDRAKVIGILKSYPTKPRKMEFVWMLDANNVIVENKGYDIILTEDEIRQFKEMSQEPDLMTKLVESFSSSIFGWSHVKEVLLLGIFGGVAKVKDDAEVRGNINVFLLGDPGTAKSQLLKYCHKVAYRSVFSTGRGVTGVGLTAALVKENERFILRAGTMALADMGVACIDEAEKMLKEDRDAVHTPMEQQIIPVNKGGLNTTLNARCATFMAANPTNGRYVQQKTVRENIEDFPDSLLTRFDFIFVMPDIVNPENDEHIVDTILRLNQKGGKKRIPLTTLKKYIIYSKRIFPTIPEEVREHLKKFFLEKRSDRDNNTGLQISFRQLESLERACEARARAHLRETVTMEDAEATIRLFEIYVRATWTDPFTGKIDMNVYEGMPASSRQQQAEYVPRIVEQMYRDGKGIPDAMGELYVRRKDLIDEMKRMGELDGYIANKVLDLAISKDLVWPPGVDKIKLEGNRNRMLGDEPTTLNTS